MRWYRDQTGRFAFRPHFEPAEIEQECRRMTEAFHRSKYGRPFEPPWSNDDLASLVEQHADSLDLYAELRAREGEDVDGLTWFTRGRSPRVEIENSLSTSPRLVNRFRTTLTHECTHVVLHGPLWQLHWTGGEGGLFDHRHGEERLKSVTYRGPRRPQVDWMEWQANYGSGAILMPEDLLVRQTADFRARRRLNETLYPGDPEAADLVADVAERFVVSLQAAEVRLAVVGVLGRADQHHQGELHLPPG